MTTATLTRNLPGVRAANEKSCIDCGRPHQRYAALCDRCGYAALPVNVRRDRTRAKSATRKRHILENGGPGVPPKRLKEIRSGSSCSYCPAPAVEVDHIWAISRGGPDIEENITAACLRCSRSKGSKLLTEWSWERVVYGLLHSEKVGRELARLSAEDVPDPLAA